MNDTLERPAVASALSRDAATEAPDVRPLREAVARKASELRTVAMALEQQVLLDDEPVFEEGFFLPPEQVRKRYTAERAQRMEMQREVAIYMLAYQCPVKDIARLLHLNERTVRALAGQNGRRLAKFSDEYALELLGSAASDIAIAETKRDDASFLQLVTGAKMKTDSALGVKLMGSAADTETILEAGVEESPALQKFRETLQQLKPARVEEEKG
jgi:hypothetical protein